MASIRISQQSQPFLRAVLAGLALHFTLLAVQAQPAQSRPTHPAERALEQAAGGRLDLKRSQLTGLPTFIGTETGRPIRLKSARQSKLEERAGEFFDSYGPALGLKDRKAAQLKRAKGPDAVGMEHAHFQQIHQGVPVTGGEVGIHLRGANVVAVTAKTLPVVDNFDTAPRVTRAQSLATASALLAKHFDVKDAVLSPPRLEIFNRGIFERSPHPTRLAWFIEAKRIDLRRYIWVDAHSGGVLLHFSQLPHALNRSVYNGNNAAALPGTLMRSEGQPATADTDTDLAYDYAGDTYNYYFIEHGRDSYDNAGAPLVSTLHYCPSPTDCPWQNAYWSGSQMVYGDGFASADDVVAHELTHAVTEHTAGLFYYMQGGALNESYSDIFGETVDLWNGHGTDTAGVRWLMGEDLTGIGAIRDMMNPTAMGDPGKMSDPQFVCNNGGFSGSADAGGVHANSGIPNHAYALMVDGGTYNGYTITGIGLTKAAKIHYRALTQYLLSASDFLDNYNALKQACQDLIGSFGITAADYNEVVKALDAVEMSATWPCSPAQPATPALCPVGQTSLDFFFDDLESGGANWVVSGSGNVWYLGSFFATSGTQHLYGDDPGATTDGSVAMNLSVAIPAGGARMQFNHSWGFENSGATYDDGGRIEYSINGGSTWLDAGGFITAGAAYNGILRNSGSNPLKGKNAFVGESYGYVTTQLDLISLADENVRFRFRIGADNSVGDYGWFIDDVRIYQCVPINDPPAITVPGEQSVNEDTDHTIPGIVAADPDAGSQNLQVALSVANGTLTLSGTAGLTFSVGDGSLDSAMTFQGTQTSINTALNNLVYRANLTYNGPDTLHVIANDLGHTGSGGPQSDAKNVALIINAVNDLPTLTDIQKQFTDEDTPTPVISFIVDDVETAATSLLVTATSSNTLLLPDSNIALAGNGASRTITLTPAANQFGSTTITVIVSDGTASASDTFELTVNSMNDLPTISDVPNQITIENQATKAIALTVGDLETPAAALIVTGTSSDQALVPNGNIAFGGSGASRNLVITPAANQSGTATITITVSDANTGTASDTFVLTVLADTDHDGMPDNYELANGLNPNVASDAALDADGDGLSNLLEYVAGTDPQNPASRAGITTTQNSGPDVIISFLTVVGKIYRIERNDIFPADSWTVVSENVPGTGNVVTVPDAGAASQTRRFYRVQVLP